jgi:RNA polymerase sigma-70 factor (ECF subfamily)
VSRTEQQQVVERFLAAVTGGDVQALMDVLAPDVVLVADGGGIAPAALVPLSGGRKVARLLAKFASLVPDARTATLWVNGAPAAWLTGEKAGETVVSFEVHEGRITRIFAMRNPEKLARITEPTELAR